MHATESPLGSKERLNSLANRQSNVALAAARAAEARSSDSSKSDTRLSAATSSSRKRRTAGEQRTENNNPRPHNNAGKKGVSNAGIQANLPDRARGCIDMHPTIRPHRGARDPTTLLLLGGILPRSGSYALHQVSLPLKIAGRHALHKSPALSLWNLNVHTGTLQSYFMDYVPTIRLL